VSLYFLSEKCCELIFVVWICSVLIIIHTWQMYQLNCYYVFLLHRNLTVGSRDHSDTDTTVSSE
jgi:hypothetical protein